MIPFNSFTAYYPNSCAARRPSLAAVVLLLLSLIVSVALTPHRLWAQSSGVVVNHVVGQEEEESLGLTLFFTLVDGNGRAVTDANPDGATIELLGGAGVPREASVRRPNTPFHIAMLLDGSGSMANVIGDVRAAAKSALENAPPTANFAVIKFNQLSVDEELRPIQDFTNDRNLVASAIDAVTADAGASTCLFNTVHKAIELLDNQIQNPQERRAIILFTDGKDETPAGTPCSQRNFDDVAYRATQVGPANTPVHTIGLCSNQQCTNLDRTKLVALAENTLGFSAIGGQTNLEALFTEIMDGLSSQWVAQTNVLASEGINQGILKLTLSNSNGAPFSLISPPFEFTSNRDYTDLRQPADVRIQSIAYDPDVDRYNLALLTTSPELIQRVIVNVWDTRRGVQVSPDLFFYNPGLSLFAELDTNTFEAGREYRVQIQALDNTEAVILKETDDTFGANDELRTILDQATIVYDPPKPPQPEPIEFSVESVNTDYDNERLIIDLDILDDSRLAAVEGFIKNSGGQKIYDFGPIEYLGKRLELPMPPALRSARGASYPVTIYLTTVDGQRSDFEFDEFLPVRPGFIQRTGTWLRRNTTIVLSAIVFLISCAIAWLFLQGRRDNQRSLAPPRPPMEGTISAIDSELLAPPMSAEAPLMGNLSGSQVDEQVRPNAFYEQHDGNRNEPSNNTVPGKEASHISIPNGITANGAMRHGSVPDSGLLGNAPSNASGSAERSVGLRMTFTKHTSDEELPATILVDFPFVIGRDEAIEHGRVVTRGAKRFFNIGDDAKISRFHVEITFQDGAYFLTDLGSRNGTFVFGNLLDALQPTRINGHTKVRLGRRTHMELEPIS